MSLGVIDCKYRELEVNVPESNLNYSKHWMTPKKKLLFLLRGFMYWFYRNLFNVRKAGDFAHCDNIIMK